MPNVIGDIAGNYKTFMALIKKMPDEEVISIGDMVDRGPRSKEVVEWFMKNGKAILGNHEHMMLDNQLQTNYYVDGIWEWNGGDKTLYSFGGSIPKNVLDWVNNLPKYMIIDKILVSHAFLCPYLTLEQACDFGTYFEQVDDKIIWNRMQPERRTEYNFQIAGHNSNMGLRTFRDKDGDFAMCIDTSRSNVLTGIHLPTMRVYQQEYIEDG